MIFEYRFLCGANHYYCLFSWKKFFFVLNFFRFWFLHRYFYLPTKRFVVFFKNKNYYITIIIIIVRIEFQQRALKRYSAFNISLNQFDFYENFLNILIVCKKKPYFFISFILILYNINKEKCYILIYCIVLQIKWRIYVSWKYQ